MLACDESCVIPFGVVVQFLITSNDVIHRWSLPNLAIKVDAVPGFLTSIVTVAPFPGVYVGMCSELCGAYHSFIPISVEATSVYSFVV